MKFKKILFTIMMIIISSNTVFAVGIAQAGDTVTQEGTYDSNRFVAGNEVINKATIDGISVIAGNDLTLEGSAPYGVYLGNMLNISEKVEKDVFAAGNKIVIENALLGRDAYIAGNNIKIKSNIARNLRAAGSLVDISGITISGNAYIAADLIVLDEKTEITGKLVYDQDTDLVGLNSAKIGKVEVKELKKEVIVTSFKSEMFGFLTKYCAAVVTLIVMLYLIPKLSTKLEKEELSFNQITKKMIAGLIVLIIIPIVTLICVFTGVLTPISLIIGAIYIASLYISSLLVGYIIGSLIMNKLIKNDNKYLKIFLGVLIIKLISIIPIIENFIPLFIMIYGLGIIYNLIKENQKIK